MSDSAVVSVHSSVRAPGALHDCHSATASSKKQDIRDGPLNAVSLPGLPGPVEEVGDQYAVAAGEMHFAVDSTQKVLVVAAGMGTSVAGVRSDTAVQELASSANTVAG